MAAKVKGLEVWFLISICSSFIALTISLLNLEELKSIQYGMEISGTPVLLRETPDLSNEVLLSSKHGQQYQCILPVIDTDELVKDENKNHTTEEITNLLQPLEKKCLYHNSGWWTYEVCFGKSISQYHEEAGNAIVGDKLLLGVYSSQTDWTQEKIEEPKSKDSTTKRFHSQYFVNGSTCELTGEPRNTQVKYSCEVDKSDYIYRVDEPSSCSYVVDVHTSRLCKHPLFRPPPVPKPKPIKCSPALSQELYDTYLATIEIKKKAEEARKIVKAKRLKEQREARRRQKKDESEYMDISDMFGEGSKRKKPIRSQLWPWESPGVENDDEVWINGNIDEQRMEVNRLDIVRGRMKINDEDKNKDESTLMIMSRGMKANRKKQKPKSDESKESAPDKDDSHKTLPQGEDAKEKENTLTQTSKTAEGTRNVESDPSAPETSGKKSVKEDHAEGEDPTVVATGQPGMSDKVATKPPWEATDQPRKAVEQPGEATEQLGEATEQPRQAVQQPRGDAEQSRATKQPGQAGDTATGLSQQQTALPREGGVEKEAVGEGKERKEDKVEEEKREKSLEDEWKDALAKARLQLRSVVRKQLQSMGVDPDQLEKKLKVMMGKKEVEDQEAPKEEADKVGEKESIAPKSETEPKTTESPIDVSEAKPDSAGLKTAASEKESKTAESPSGMSEVKPDFVGLKAAVSEKINKLTQEVEEMESDGRLQKDSKEKRMLLNIKKLINGMDRQNVVLMKKEETLRKALEKHFDELSGRFSMEAAMMNRFVEDIEEGGRHGEHEDNYLKDLVERLKGSVQRFDKATRELSKDMAAVKDLNKEVHSKIDGIVIKAGDKGQGSNFFRLAAKANLLLRQLLQRSSQLDKEMRAIREISREAVARREDYLDNEDDVFDSKVKEEVKLKGKVRTRMDSIVEKLKNMVQDIDSGREDYGDKLGEAVEKLGSQALFGDDNIKVRVTKIKGEDGNPLWSDNEGEEDPQEMGMEAKLRRATKRMENIVKEQLKNAGVAPAGKVRVKIITSKEALENFGGDKGMQFLSDQETSQFKKMVLNLLGGTQEASEERKRQMDLENNYNLVWNENQFSKARPEDEEEAEAEVTFDDTEY